MQVEERVIGVKNPPANAGDVGSLRGSGRSPREGNGNPLQYSCLGESPWAEEPGGLQSMGSQRVGHDLATKQQSIKPNVKLMPDNLIKRL